MHGFNLRLRVVPKGSHCPLKLATHEQDACPNAPSAVALARWPVKVPLAVPEEDISKRAQRGGGVVFIDLKAFSNKVDVQPYRYSEKDAP